MRESLLGRAYHFIGPDKFHSEIEPPYLQHITAQFTTPCIGLGAFRPVSPRMSFRDLPSAIRRQICSDPLAAAIIGVHLGKSHGEGELEIGILVCEPRIAVPVMPDDSRGSGPLSNSNRISVRA